MTETTRASVESALRLVMADLNPHIHVDVLRMSMTDELDIRLRFNVHASVPVSERELMVTRGSPGAFLEWLLPQLKSAIHTMCEMVQPEDMAELKRSMSRLHERLVDERR